MTEYTKVYEAFLAKMLDDEWGDWTAEENGQSLIEQDLRSLLEGAIPWFKFPRVNLDDRDDNGFNDNLNNEEIQILACYMKCQWLNRTILTWEHVKPLYSERDFSQANLIDKLNKLLESEKETAARLESIYYRTIHHKPFDYSRLTQQ